MLYYLYSIIEQVSFLSKSKGFIKKLPLYVGMLLVIIWCASIKMNNVGTKQLFKEKRRQLTSLIADVKTNDSLDIATLSKEEFYNFLRPEVSDIISDAELYQFYEDLKRNDLD